MNLATLDLNAASAAGAELQLLDPVTRVPLAVYIMLAGADAIVYRQAIMDRVRVRQQQGSVGGGDDRTAAQIEEDACAIMARCTLAWRGVEDESGALICNEENACKLYSRFTWIRQQVADFVERRANFLPRSEVPS
jgi:hypothetical protein